MQIICEFQSYSSLSQNKIHEIGVHSSMNVARSTVSDRDTTSLTQAIIGRDSSNLLMTSTLPKSDDTSPTIRRILLAL